MLHCVPLAPALDKPGAVGAIEAAFERMGVFAYYHSTVDTLSIYAAGKTTGCAVDLGGGSVRVSCIYEGYSLPQAMVDLGPQSGGDHLTGLTREALSRRGFEFDFNVCEYIKTKMLTIPRKKEEILSANIPPLHHSCFFRKTSRFAP